MGKGRRGGEEGVLTQSIGDWLVFGLSFVEPWDWVLILVVRRCRLWTRNCWRWRTDFRRRHCRRCTGEGCSIRKARNEPWRIRWNWPEWTLPKHTAKSPRPTDSWTKRGASVDSLESNVATVPMFFVLCLDIIIFSLGKIEHLRLLCFCLCRQL